MATHSSVLAWRIAGTAEPGGLPSMGSHRVGHDWSDLAPAAACIYLIYMHHTLCIPEVLFVNVDCLGLYRSMASLRSCREGPPSTCGVQASRCRGFLGKPRAPRCPGFRNHGMWAQQLWVLDSRAQAHLWLAANRLSYSTACGVLPEQAPSCVSCIGRRVL